jgi:hypothetical protein
MAAAQTVLRYGLMVLNTALLIGATLLTRIFQYINPRDLISNSLRIIAVFLAVTLFKTFTSPNTSQATYPLSVGNLNNSTLSFETVILLSSKPAFKAKATVHFGLPTYENGILHATSSDAQVAHGLLSASTLQIEPNGPKRKGHTAAITRVVEKGYSTALILEEKVGVNARLREELYWIHRALRARPIYEDMQMSDLHKLKGYWDEPDAIIPVGPQPVYAPYYRMPPSVDTTVDEFVVEKMLKGKGLGRMKERQKGVGEWDMIFLGDCREQFDEEAQMKLRSQSKEITPWRRMDWVAKEEETVDLWVPELTEVDRKYEKLLREKKREVGQVGEKQMLGRGLRRSDDMQDACILGYAVSQRGALKLQKHFGASDPGLGTQDLMARFCGGADNVCFTLSEGVVRERKQN